MTDAGLASFQNCKSLGYLDLGNSGVSDAGLAHFKDSKNLIDVVLGRDTNRSPGELGLAAMKIVDGACQSVRSNTNVKVPWW